MVSISRLALLLPESTNCSSTLSDMLFPCWARAVNANALYKPSLVTYPSCLGSTASQIFTKKYKKKQQLATCMLSVVFNQVS